MAVTADKVVVELELRDGQYLTRVRQSEQAFTQSQNRVARSAEDAERRIRASSAGISSALKGAAAGIAAGVSVAAVKNLADTYTQLQNRLKVTGLEGAALEAQYARLNQVATDSRTGIEATVQVYSRLRTATEGLGLSNEQVTRTTEILAKSLASSGATASETSAALLQFGQAIGSGVLQGDELRSIRENAPAVARAIAAEFGVTVGELKKLGEEGKLTSDRVVQAVLKSGTEIDALFAKTEATVGNALTNLGNQLLNYVGQTDDSLTATERVAGAINLLADNLDKVVPVIATLATVVGGRYAIAMTTAAIQTGIATVNSVAYQLALARMAAAQTGATTAQVLLNGALSANPIGIAVTAVALLAGGLAILATRYNTTAVAARELDRVTSAADTAISDYAAAVLEAKSASGQERVELLKKAEALREVTAARIADARVAAQRQIDEAVSARARADESIRQAGQTRERVGTNSSSNAGAALVGGAQATAQGDINFAVRQREEADRAIISLQGLERAQSRAAAGAVDGGVGSPPAADDKKKKGPSAETLARREEAQRRRVEDVAAEEELAVAQARNDEDTIRRLERQADIRTRQRDIIDASTDKLIAARTVEQALAEATATQEKIDAARLETRERLTAEQQLEFDILNASVAEEYERLRALERQKELADLVATFKGLEYDEVEATRRANEALLQIEAAREVAARRRAETQALELEAQIARLENDSVSLKAAERELEIQERTLELLRERKDLSEEQAKNIATNEADKKDAAALIGGLGNPEDAGEVRQAAYEEAQRLREEDLISEADYAQRKLQIDAEYWEARTAGTRGMLDTLAGLQNSSNKKLAAIGKAAAITQATIDGVLAVQKALSAFPPPFNFVQAAIVGAVAAANVAQIAGLKDGGIVTGSGGPREDNQLRRLSVGEFVNNAASVRKNRPYLEAANNGADLSKMLPGLRDGGYVSRVNVATPRLSDRSSRSVSNVFSPSIDARGADLAAASRIEQIMEEQSRTFADRVNGVRDRRNAYRLGGRK